MKSQFILSSVIIIHCILSSFIGIGQQLSKSSEFPDEIRERNFFKRYEWFYQQRANPDGSIPFAQANRAVNKELREIENTRFTERNGLKWHSLGPKGFKNGFFYNHIVSGRVRAIAVHPSDPDIVYIGAASGGIWKSIDGGESWLDIGRDLASLTFGAICIDPQNPDIIYAGAGEPVHTITTGIVFGGKGLYKSTDGGDSWIRITHGFGTATTFTSLAVSPYHPNILFAGLASGSINLDLNMPNEGIWKSTDSGETWYRVLDLPDACDIKFNPQNENICYASIGGTNENSGFYISNDLGENWISSNNGLSPPYKMSRVLFDFCLSDLNVFYSIIYEYTPTSYGPTSVYKSIDGGKNWTKIGIGTNFGQPYDQGPYDLCIGVDPLDPNHLFVGNRLLFESKDGNAFNIRSMTHTDIHSLVFSRTNPNYFYIGTDGGIYLSQDNGASCKPINKGLETLQFYRIGSHPTDPNIFMGGMQDNCSIITFDGGETWRSTTGGDGMNCMFNFNNPQIVYGSAQKGDFAKSTNGGLNWSWFIYLNGAWITPLVMHPSNPDTMYSVTRNFIQLSPSYKIIKPNVTPTLINALAQSQLNPKCFILASGSQINGPYKPEDEFLVKISIDRGYNWTDVTENIPGDKRWISSVKTDPFNAETMYVVRCGYSEGNKIYKTEDLGQTWTNISGNLPDIPCNDLFINPEIEGYIYVATDLGVYGTQDFGMTWNHEGDGMPLVPVLDFDYVKIDNIPYLRVGTFGRSIYETTDLLINVNEIASKATGKLICIPNPFSNDISIEYDLLESSEVKIYIYDQEGRLVYKMHESQKSGKNIINWNAGGLQDATYYCKVIATKQILTGKMIKISNRN